MTREETGPSRASDVPPRALGSLESKAQERNSICVPERRLAAELPWWQMDCRWGLWGSSVTVSVSHLREDSGLSEGHR